MASSDSLAGRRPPLPFLRGLGALEVEDIVLAAWLLALEMFLAARLDPGVAFGPNGWPSLLGWAVFGAFLIVFVSRGPADSDLDQALMSRMFVLGPLVFFFSMFAPLTNFVVYRFRAARARRLGNPSPTPWQGWPGPPLPTWLRRSLALPFTLMGELAFRRSIGNEIDLWLGGRSPSELPPFLFFALATLVAIFGFLVVGPRVIAGSDLAWRPWLLRFGLYLVALAAGVGFAP